MHRKNGLFTNKFNELKKRAEVWIEEQKEDSFQPLSVQETRKLVHELHSYQIELELQNEDLRLAQAELELSRRRFNDLYDFAPVGYLTVSDKGLIVESNLTAAAMVGVVRPKLFNRSPSVYILRDDQHIYYHFRKKLLETNKNQTCELRMQRADGSFFHAYLESTIIPEVDGDSGQFRVSITDISKQKELEVNLWRAKTEWENTFDAIDDVVTIQDRDMRIVRANKAAHELFNVLPGELNGRKCYDVFLGTDKPCPNCPELKTLKTKKTATADIANANLKRTFNITSSPLLNENKEFSQIVHIARDITASKKMEAELFQARKMEAIGRLAGGIAHDFNNILAAIIGFSEIIKGNLPKSSESRNHIDQVLKAGNRARDLVKQILTFSRKSHERLMPMNPSPIIREALKLMRASLPTTIEIQDEIETNCGSIQANPTHIHQVLVNLCTNALHAMEDQKGVLTVKLSRVELTEKDITADAVASAGPFVELLIRDTGCGIDSDDIDHIFEPYFTTRAFGKGNGVGLAVVHGIVQSCEGFIKIESELKRGTTFHVYFPVIKENESITKVEKETILPRGNERILVVDDEEAIIHIYKEILERLGYTVTATTSSVKTLKLFEAAPDKYDLLITDQTMPLLTGSELVQEILRIRPDLPVILCTGYSSIISKEQALGYGVKKFLMKPAGRKALALSVREVLDN